MNNYLIVPFYICNIEGHIHPRVQGIDRAKQAQGDYSLINPAWDLGILLAGETLQEAVTKNIAFNARLQRNPKAKEIPTVARVSQNPLEYKWIEPEDAYLTPSTVFHQVGDFDYSDKKTKLYLMEMRAGMAIGHVIGYQMSDVIYEFHVARNEKTTLLVNEIENYYLRNKDKFDHEV